MQKITIETTKEELNLIRQALELYTRVGLLQFNNLTLCSSLHKLVWDRDLQEEFDKKCTELKGIFNISPGIFNKEFVTDDVRVAADMYQTISHELWNAKEDKERYSLDATPSDICRIAKIKQPNFDIYVES